MTFKHAFVLFFTLLSSYLLYSQNDTSAGNHLTDFPDSVQLTDSFINVRKLNDKTILIRMGYDAVTAISTQKGIVVLDAGISAGLTEKYRKIICNEFQQNNVAYLINTHGHPDHTGGNSIFSDAVIVGHKNCSDEISQQWKEPYKVKTSLLKIVNNYEKELGTLGQGTAEWNNVFCQKTRYQYAYNDVLKNISVTKPNLTFSDSLDIDIGDVKFNLIYFGKAHSESDIIVHIPEMKILMVGDLFSKYGRPGIPDMNKLFSEKWMTAEKWIENRMNNIEIIITGHGEILSKDDLISFNNFVKKYIVRNLDIPQEP
jgi:glyoxylase-like metal-dependent hydrolase (beta-lactamase superfamily II)